MKEFSPRIYFGNTLIFYFVFGVFSLIGATLMLGYLNDVGQTASQFSILGINSTQSLGLIFFLFGLIVILFLLIINLALGSHYNIDGDGIIIYKNWFTKRLPFSTIAKVEKMEEKSAQELVKSLRASQLNVLDYKTSYNSSKELANLLRYCTVPITFEEMTFRGSGKYIKVTGTQTAGDFICLTTQDGKAFLLSPKDVEGFLTELSVHINK